MMNFRTSNKITTSLLALCLLATGCQRSSSGIEPSITFIPPPHLVEQLPSPFLALSPAERAQEWGKELFLGKAFARQTDLYRAITCFKRALFLIPTKDAERRMEIEYEIFLAYYLGNKFQEAVDAFETTNLLRATATFPPFRELLILLYDAYTQIGQDEKAERLMCFITAHDAEIANTLQLETAIIQADFPAISRVSESEESSFQNETSQFLCDYETNIKSITKAKYLNAILPGAGYLYVGQKSTALTSFLINAVFIAASYQLYERGYIPAAIILTSLECGWYLGGINGAGLAAGEYNRNLYECLGRETLTRNHLFPILMIQKGF